jgi:hypothetical protein
MLSRSGEAIVQLKPNEMLSLAERYACEAQVDVRPESKVTRVK